MPTLTPDQLKYIEERDARINARLQQAGIHNSRRMGDTVTNLGNIPWPADPYGYDHAKQTQMLSAYILEGLGVTSERDFHIMRVIGLFHDLGRVEPWHKEDPGHNVRSAEATAQILREDSQWWAHKDLHAEMCQLIARHSLRPLTPGERWQPPTDPRLIALHDAECFEAARLAPRTPEGMTILKTRMGQVITQWAKVVEHQQRWRDTRGW